MSLIPLNYNPAFEGAKTVNTAATVVNGEGLKVSVSLDCKNFETLLEIEENISNISLTEWDNIVFYAAI